MGTYADGCHGDHSDTKAILVEKPTDSSREVNSSNDFKLAKNEISINFNDTSLLVLAKEDDIEYEKTFYNSSNHADETSESLRNYFHLNNADTKQNPCEEFCAEDASCDEYAFDRFEYRIPTAKQNWSNRLVANSIMVVDRIHNHESGRLLRVLFDSGGDRTMIHRSALPRCVNPMILDKRARMNTLAGTYESGVEVMLKDLRLLEFDKSRNILRSTKGARV